MKPGMPLFDTSRHTARKSKVRRVVIVNKPVETYNIEVEKYHNYFISNNTKCILTHNASKNSSFVSTKKFNYNIYKILDPDDDVIYVGRTIQMIEERLKQHRKDKRKVKRVSLMKEVDWLIEKVGMTNYEAAVWETYHIGENGGLSKMNKNTLLKNKQIPIGKMKFEKFQKLGTFNPCKLLI